MSEQNKQIIPMELANKINRWNFDKSVTKMKEHIQQWKNMTAQVARELFLAKEFLTNQKGQRRDPEAPDYIIYTWQDYCEVIGMDRQIADYWIKKFIPREISGTNKDILLIKAPVKTEMSVNDRALMQTRMKEVLYSGERPSDWTDDEEKEYQKILENARISAIVEKYGTATYFKPNDYFADALKHSKKITNFKLDRPEQKQFQQKVFKLIEEYLSCFDNFETKSLAAFNLALITRNLSNEIAEENFQIKNAQAEESGDDS